MKARGKYERQEGAYKRLKKRIDSKKVSKEFLEKRLPKLMKKNKSTEEKEIQKYWERRQYELSQLSSKGFKNNVR